MTPPRDSFDFMQRLLTDWSAGARASELLDAVMIVVAELDRRGYVVRVHAEPRERD